MAIIFGSLELDRIVENSQDTFPIEACGILLGTRDNEYKRVEMVFPTKNILESENLYELEPQEQLKIFTKADELSFEVLGYYHSHPYWPAQPSDTDYRTANQPGCSYIIYSCLDNEVRSFHWDGYEFRAEELVVSDD